MLPKAAVCPPPPISVHIGGGNDGEELGICGDMKSQL